MLFSLLLSCFFLSNALKHPDEVKHLPGLNAELNYKQYSGYLNASDGNLLHYWFVESQNFPCSDPVILWLNGGPGCSSVNGLLTELGPFRVSSDGKKLYEVVHSWNKVANILFLESPAGVGFSYAHHMNYSTDDDKVAHDNYLALLHFLKKFPDFKGNDFYIMGESYAGIYIPTLSLKVLKGGEEINFKGFAIGNGQMDAINSMNSIVFFSYYHGLIGHKLWKRLALYCCKGVAAQENCNFCNSDSHECQNTVQEVADNIVGAGINIYNIYSDCKVPVDNKSQNSFTEKNIQSGNIKQGCHKLKGIPVVPPCINSSAEEAYLNQQNVRQSLHIPSFVQDWKSCSYEVAIGYIRKYVTMKETILELIQSGKLRGLIYNGDADLLCNFLGGEWFTEELGLKVIGEYKEWKYDGQVAGFANYYENLTFLTIKGAGHMVPEDKPGPALQMISRFLKNEPF